MRFKGPRQTALAVAALLAATAPAARAGTITLAELQAAGASAQLRPASELRLRVAPQSGGVAIAQGVQGQQSGSGGSGGTQPQQAGGPVGSRVAAGPAPDGSLSGTGGQIIETVDFGDVTGTVCDCGEIPVAALPKVAGAFPWWAFAGIPLVCVSGICFDTDDETTPNPTPTPPTPPTQPTPPPPPMPTPPPPAPIPEPATLLLFGTGLAAAAAGARRRRTLRQTDADAGEEV